MAFDQTLDDGKPEPRTRSRACTLEAFDDPTARLGGDARTLIVDHDRHPLGSRVERHRDGALIWRMLYRVTHQVLYQRFDGAGLLLHTPVGVLIGIEQQLLLAFGGQWRELGQGFLGFQQDVGVA